MPPQRESAPDSADDACRPADSSAADHVLRSRARELSVPRAVNQLVLISPSGYRHVHAHNPPFMRIRQSRRPPGLPIPPLMRTRRGASLAGVALFAASSSCIWQHSGRGWRGRAQRKQGVGRDGGITEQRLRSTSRASSQSLYQRAIGSRARDQQSSCCYTQLATSQSDSTPLA
jgi:hypothetical protein